MNVKIKLDTSVQLNVMPYKCFKKLKIPLKDSSVVIKAFGEFKIKLLGKVEVLVKNNNNNTFQTNFEVVQYNDLPILGLVDCRKMNYSILQTNEIHNS